MQTASIPTPSLLRRRRYGWQAHANAFAGGMGGMVGKLYLFTFRTMQTIPLGGIVGMVWMVGDDLPADAWSRSCGSTGLDHDV